MLRFFTVVILGLISAGLFGYGLAVPSAFVVVCALTLAVVTVLIGAYFVNQIGDYSNE